MTEEFDKEIDTLLRQAAQGETVSANSGFRIQDSGLPHLDADEISLFAENALPAKMRQNAVAHFADCDRCRKILSVLIAENIEDKIVPAAQIELFPASISWYRKLFAFPNLAYTLGALVIVFSGIIAFTVLQSVENSQTAEVSQVSERQLNGKGMSSDGDAAIVETANSNMTMAANTMSNTAMMNSAAALPSNAARSNSAMSNASTNSAPRSSAANSATNTSTAAAQPTVAANEFTTDGAQADSVITQKSISELPVNGRMVNNLNLQRQESEKKSDKKDAETTDSTTSPAPTKTEQPAVAENQSALSGAPSAKARKKVRTFNDETTSVGGKTFERQNNSWIDAAYKNQSLINITRGTSEYKKLDSDVRRIAENLGGIIIVVWKDKAYRIQ